MRASWVRRLGLAALTAWLPACGTDTVVAPSLTASCGASPSSGRAPLVVSFSLNVGGAEGAITVRINYGDGATGTEAGAPHTYASPGSYTASFDVTTPTQSALCSTTVRVDAPAPPPTPPPSGPNRAPDVVFTTNPLPDSSGKFQGVGTLTVSFNVCRTSDPEGDALSFRMDLDGDGRFEEEGSSGADCRHSRDYDVAGTYVPRVCVTDLNPSSQAPAHPYQCRDYVVELAEAEEE